MRDSGVIERAFCLRDENLAYSPASPEYWTSYALAVSPDFVGLRRFARKIYRDVDVLEAAAKLSLNIRLPAAEMHRLTAGLAE